MTTRHPQSRRLVATIKILRRELPTMFPVRLRRKRIPDAAGAWATCDLLDDEDGAPSHFEIVVDDRLTEPAASWGLIHEYAHALSWRMPMPRDNKVHDPEFGLAYSRTYNIWESL